MDKNIKKEDEVLPKREWYIATCVPNKEKIVAERLRGLSKSNHMKDFLFRVFVPTIKEIDKNGKEKEKIPLIYKGKVFIEMILTPYSYGESRVSDFGFILPSKDPTPMNEEEIKEIYEMCGKTYYPYEEYKELLIQEKICE